MNKKLDTSEARKILADNLGDFINEHIVTFSTTEHWVYLDGIDIVAFEDVSNNILYIFNTTGFLSKFINDNSWTFDGIVDFESKSQVLYHYGTDGELKSTEYLVSELSQNDVDAFAEHLEWILMEEVL